jgi:integrase
MKVRLTERSIESLKTSKNQEDIFHVPTPSAGLRLTREGRKTWFIYYRSPVLLDGKGLPKLRRLYLGEHRTGKAGQGKYLTLEEFRKAYEVIRGTLAHGIDPQSGTGAPVPSWTSSGHVSISRCSEAEDDVRSARVFPVAAVPEWLQSVFPKGYTEGTLAHRLSQYFEAARTGKGTRQLAPRSLKNYVAGAKTHLVPRWGTRRATSITQDCVFDVFAELAKRAPQMVRQIKKVLAGLYKYCRANVREMRHFPNPTQGIKIEVPKAKRDRWLNDDELQILLPALDRLSDSKARDIYNLILASACRPGEAAGVQAEDIITVGGERVWRVRYKVDRDHLIPLVGPIGEIINRRYVECGGKGSLFWANVDRTKDYPEQLTRANREIRELTGLENYRPHDNRRTARTHFEILGIRAEVGEALLNHQKGEIEGTYALYTYWPERKEALSLWHRKLEALRQGTQEKAA